MRVLELLCIIAGRLAETTALLREQNKLLRQLAGRASWQ
jgi:hypothetical protein